MHSLSLIGLNHTTAPLVVRERLAFAPQQGLVAITELQKRTGGEVVLLSTCNRVELYLAGSTPISREAVVSFLSDFHNLPAEQFQTHLYEQRAHGVVGHLFSVASSLDSMVLGETQILGQVRQAYETARQIGATGPMLNPLFQRAISVGKEVLSGTGLGEGRLSIASVAVDYAKRIFDTFADKTVLCLGTGKMSQLVLQHFVNLGAGRLLVASREQSRADAFAQAFGGSGVAMADLDKHLVSSDIVVTSTGATHPIITKDRFAKLLRQRRYRPIFVIDIAVPRDVEAGVGDLESVYLYNLDDLQLVVSRTLSERSQQLEAARTVVHRHVEQFLQWHREREIGPVIDALYQRYNAIARAELDRTLGKMPLDEAGKQHLEELVHRIVQKMLHDPVRQLKQGHDPRESAGPAYLHAVEKLFR
ncbi:MAG: glutamyl-tRNA reductase, partial [Tepidisphaeraceae bacterium]